jgi:hypothetical protein
MMTTIANCSNGVPMLGLRAKLDKLLGACKRRLRALEAAWIDHHFQRQRAARERVLSRAHDRYELERLERAFDRGEGENWRVF